jgi:hypothetical protein
VELSSSFQSFYSPTLRINESLLAQFRALNTHFVTVLNLYLHHEEDFRFRLRGTPRSPDFPTDFNAKVTITTIISQLVALDKCLGSEHFHLNNGVSCAASRSA